MHVSYPLTSQLIMIMQDLSPSVVLFSTLFAPPLTPILELCLTLELRANSTYYIASCPAGWISTEDGNCADDNECVSDPCYNGGTCTNLDNGQGFACSCPDGFTGDICHLPVQEKIILVASGAYWVIAFVLINVLGKLGIL